MNLQFLNFFFTNVTIWINIYILIQLTFKGLTIYLKQIAVYSFLFFTTIWNILGKKIVVAPRLNNMILMFSYENLNIHSINICPIGFVDSFECPTYSNWSKYNLERYDEVWQNELKRTNVSSISISQIWGNWKYEHVYCI